MSKLADCVVGIGANLGPRLQNLRLGVAALAPLGRIVGISSLYETVALGPPQPDYLNAAIRLHSPLDPLDLLQAMLRIEHSLGRLRRERWGARTLDLDLLWIARRRIDVPGLTVPHPRLPERAFAILPLLDVAPTAADPSTGELYRHRLSSLELSGVRQCQGPAWAQ